MTDRTERGAQHLDVSAVHLPAASEGVSELPAVERVAQATAAIPPATITIALENGSIARLPADADLSVARANGADLEFVQPDGTVIVITGGAIAGLVIFVGDVEIPADAVATIFASNGIVPAAGPETSGNDSGSGSFVDLSQQSVGDGLQAGGLLGNTDGPKAGVISSELGGDANVAPVILAHDGGRVSEEGLAEGFADADGNSDSTDSVTLTGRIVVSDVGPLTFAFLQPTGLYTSGGTPITWVAAGGTLVGSAGTETIFEATIDATGIWTVTISGPFDHPLGLGENELPVQLNVLVSDTGGLSTPTTLTIIVEDDMPALNGKIEEVVIDESGLLNGEAAPRLDGALPIDLGADGGTIALSAEGATWNQDRQELVSDDGLWRIDLNDDGTYTFLLFENSTAHSADVPNDILDVHVTYTATDADGDVLTGDFTLGIRDDAPSFGEGITRGRVDEDRINANGNTASEHLGGNYDGDATGPAGDDSTPTATFTGNLAIRWGADNENSNVAGTPDRDVAFVGVTNGQVATYNVDGVPADLTSNGQVVHIWVSADGHTLVGYTGSDHSVGSKQVFTVTLSDAGTGSYTFTLLQNLDHPIADTEDDISLGLKVRATDSDGDHTDGTIWVRVDDDAPTFTAAPQAGQVDEEWISLSGNTQFEHTYPGDGQGLGVAAGSLNISWGMDRRDGFGDIDRSVAFTGTINGVQYEQNSAFEVFSANTESVVQLTHDGEPVRLWLSPDGTVLLGYVGETEGTPSLGQQVFVIALTDGGSGGYVFTLLKSLDHPMSDVEDDLRLEFEVRATDADGDSVTSTVSITVNDDAPRVSSPQTVTVDEDGLAGGNTLPAGINGDVPGAATSATGSLSIAWGVDDANSGAANRSVAFSGIVNGANAQSTDGALTSGGVQVKLWVVGTTVYGYTGSDPADASAAPASGKQVFTVSLSDAGTGSYTFTLLKPLDHPAGDGENDLRLNFGFVATDSDGDSVGSQFTVRIDDDAPTAGAKLISGSVSEAGLPLVQSDFHDLSINWGADTGAGRHIEFANTAITDSAGNPLSSGGQTLSYKVVQSDGGTNPLDQKLIAYVGNDSSNDSSWVFSVNLTSNAAAYQFALYRPLDHLGSNDSALDILFSVKAVDADGDSVIQNFTVHVADAVPVAVKDDAVEFNEDSGVHSGNVLTNDIQGADGATLTKVTFDGGQNWKAIASDGVADGKGAYSFTLAGVGTYTFAANGAWTFAAAANFAGQTSFAYIITDADGDESDPRVTIDNPQTITIVPVNDAPEGVDAKVVIDEDGSRTLQLADFDYSDVEHHPLEGVRIDALPAAGTLSLNGQPVSVNTFISAAEIAAGLLVYRPEANANGAGYASLKFSVIDAGGTANGGQNTDPTSNTLTFDVNAVNDAPTIHAPSVITTDEDTPVTFTGQNAVVLGDPDGNVPVSARIEVTNGSLYIPATGESLTGWTNVNGYTLSTLNSWFATAVFTPIANSTTPGTIEIFVSDQGNSGGGGALTANHTVTININPVNDAPEGVDAKVVIDEDGSRTLQLSDFDYSDVDHHPLEGVRIDALPAAGTLSLNGQPVSVNAIISAADIAAGLLVYRPEANANGAGYASLKFSVIDAGGTANGGQNTDPTSNTLTFDVTALNDAPTVAINGSATTYTENQPSGTFLSGVQILDTDDAELSSATLRLTNAQDGDRLWIGFAELTAGATGYVNVYGADFGYSVSVANGALVVTFTGSNSPVRYEQLLQLVRFDSTSENPATGDRVVTVTVNDGEVDSAPATSLIHVADVNDAPLVFSTWRDGSEDNALLVVLSGADIDGSIASFKLGTLNLHGKLYADAGLTQELSSNATVSATGNNATFYFKPDANWNGAESFDYTSIDDDGASNPSAATVHLTVQPVNDAPTILAPLSITTNEDTPVTFTGQNAVIFGDPDGNVTVWARIVVSNGSLYFPQTGETITGASMITGANVGDLNSWFATAVFTPNANSTTPGSIEIFVDDQGALGGGGRLTVAQTITININPVNDAPVIAGVDNATIAENAAGVLIDSFTVSDIDTATGLTFRVLRGGNVDSRFEIAAADGTTQGAPGTYELRLKAGQSFDYEAEAADSDPSINLTIEVNDNSSANMLATKPIRILVTDVFENVAPVIGTSTVWKSVTEDFSFTVPQGERVTNGSFEGPTSAARLSGWTVNNMLQLGEPHSGSNALSPYMGTGSLSQTISTVPGATYRIQFWASNPYDTVGEVESLTVNWGGQSVLALGNVPGSGAYANYTLYSIDVTAQSYQTVLSIALQDTKGYWLIDDVSVATLVMPGVETVSGTIALTDGNVNDSHVVSFSPSASGYLGTFTPVITNSATGDGAGVVTWTFKVNDADIQQLALNQTLTQSYTVYIQDSNGGVSSQQVSVAIGGSNDLPDFGSGQVTGSVTEPAIAGPQSILVNGSFEAGSTGWTATSTVGGNSFTTTFPGEGAQNFAANSYGRYTGVEAQLAQTLSTIPGVQYTLRFSVATTSQELDGRVYVNWNGVQVLALSSGQAQGTYHTFTATVTGTGQDSLQFVVDDPELPTDFKSWYLDAVTLTPAENYQSAHGSIRFTDVDALDDHTIAVSTPPNSAYVGTFVPVVDQVGNTVNWTFYASDAQLQSLPAGPITQVYTLTISDGHGGTDTQTVTVTLNGVNDVASITGPSTGTVQEDGSLTAGGTLNVSDVDAGQAGYQVPASLAGTYGNFTFNPTTGVWGYSLNNAAANVQNLNASDVVHDKLTVTSLDGTATKVIDVTITGSDDVVASPLTVNDTTSAAGRYALANDSEELNSINLDARSLFSGGTGPVSYSYALLYSSTGDASWLQRIGTLFTGNPSSNDAGLYVYKVTATDTVSSASTFVGFEVLPDGAFNLTINSPSNSANVTGSAPWLITYSDGYSDAITATLNNTREANAGSGYDILIGSGGSNNFNGGADDDALYGMGGDDTLLGGANTDYVNGGAGNDTIEGGGSNDFLVGGSGDDTFRWNVNDGVDVVDGGVGTDKFVITGNSSQDLVYVTLTSGVISDVNGVKLTSIEQTTLDLAGSGSDTLTYISTGAVSVNLATGTATGFTSLTNVERVVGGDGNDILTGNSADNRLSGGAGNDILIGGTGKDFLTGGSGSDTFKFAEPTGAANKDTIADFVLGDGDRVDLSGLLDAAFSSGQNVADFVRVTGSGTTLTVQVDTNGTIGGQGWTDVVDLSNLNTSGHDSVRVFFEGVDVIISD